MEEMKARNPEEEEEEPKEYEELLRSLPQANNWAGTTLHLYHGVWCDRKFFEPLLNFRAHFRARDSDVVIATLPKSGTTWIKALTFSIANRTLHSPLMSHSPLLTSNPHDLVPFLEFSLYGDDPSPPLHHLPSPRLFSTHAPPVLLPGSVKDSSCRIVYVCRNPLDQFVSHLHFFQKVGGLRERDEETTVDMEEAFDVFCKGIQMMGPPWDHALGYWKMSLERPEKVLFLKFEELKEDVAGCARRVAEFLGCPFTAEEEARGVVEDVVRLCSFDTMKGFEVNRTGRAQLGMENRFFFRKGEVGDWANHLTPAMAERVKRIVEEKLRGSGLSLI